MRNVQHRLAITACAIHLSGCVSYRDFEGAPEIPGAETTQLESLGNERFRASKPITAWWKSLDNELLNELVEAALENNKDVEIAAANLLEARAIAGETRFDRWPTVRSQASLARSRTSGELAFFDSITTYEYDGGFDATWELDLFGQVTQRIRGAEARAAASQARLSDAYVTVAAEIARTYIELRGAQYRLDIAQRNAANQRETYDLTIRLEEGGRSTALDIAQAEAQLRLTESTIPTFRALVNATIHRLSVLTGQTPDALRDTLSAPENIPSIPKAVNVGDVSELLRRRPDIRRAEQDLAAAIADYNISVADQFPTVDIVGALGFAATTIGSFGASAIAASIGPTVNWAAFDMGRVRARIRQSDARAQAALAAYEKTVLIALEELQTAVSDFSREEERRRSLQIAARSSKEAANLSRTRFEAGVDTFLSVLTAEATLLQAEDALAQSEINAALDLISIYKALGGGWRLEEPPTDSSPPTSTVP